MESLLGFEALGGGETISADQSHGRNNAANDPSVHSDLPLAAKHSATINPAIRITNAMAPTNDRSILAPAKIDDEKSSDANDASAILNQAIPRIKSPEENIFE